nr:DNA-directed RNA polymerase subunit beta [Lysinibacillus timonensis]
MTNELMSEKREKDISKLRRVDRRRQRTVTKKEARQRRDEDKKTPESTKELILSRLLSTAIKLLLFIAVLLLSAVVGLMIGYGVIGTGNPIDALNWATWQHMLDIINGKE